MGKDVFAAEKYRGMLQARGFENVDSIKFGVPLNPWASNYREIGRMMQVNSLSGISSISVTAFSKLGIPLEEVEAMSNAAREDIKDTGIRPYMSL